ncbi:oxygen-independent coproporphyrinogen III oxidase [Alteromonas sediminis]|uniref:Coproporphyrinogen-III oxidase n=1 Tax=Alteromonas sediminis TaxID=2259342 RepID=A0A3N5Y7D3_9ALTE|nr:oxygen-independent coproporphyrinogen III oxidase [Alteromonas sediminis]RPJ66669.1 oxygen-independent coproporphyrinogen III oxidase [Alteromonas sediminis]
MFTRPELLAKYNKRVPRYTSYPTALMFNTDFGNDDFERAARDSINEQLSLYVHIPFCKRHCYYCGCNRIVTRHQDKADQYLDALEVEMATRAPVFSDRDVTHIHLGGGTPNFLSSTQFTRLTSLFHKFFNVSDTLDYSVELDPGNLTKEELADLKRQGVTRISMGVQDTNIVVQEAINRVQSTEHVGELVHYAHGIGICSVNLDLIYGLPFQNLTRFKQTIADVIAMSPDRISLFNYAHLPERFAGQRKIKPQWLPSAAEKLSLISAAVKAFEEAGFCLIGLDHFAKPNDTLAKASVNGCLHRNFQGYTTEYGIDLLGMGASSISAIGSTFSQNAKALPDYYALVDESGAAVERGVKLSNDDRLRQYVIMQLMCNLKVCKQQTNALFDIEFDEYFKEALEQLASFVDDGVVTITPDSIRVLPEARLLIRNICYVFDAYGNSDASGPRYSNAL